MNTVALSPIDIFRFPVILHRHKSRRTVAVCVLYCTIRFISGKAKETVHISKYLQHHYTVRL